jgi:alpha-tubulin suppressor-like RCC1 family protein
LPGCAADVDCPARQFCEAGACHVAAIQVGAGTGYACAVLVDGTVRCWGSGPLGNGTTTSSPVPLPVVGLGGVSAIAAGEDTACALLMDGTLRCWGSNFNGLLGNPSFTGQSSNVPIVVTGVSGALAVSVGETHACALLSDHTVVCWGDNSQRQLGGSTPPSSVAPVAVPSISGATALAAGSSHTCALLGGGVVQCWGSNIYGQLAGTFGASAVVSGFTHSCALVSGGAVCCWGQNDHFQLNSSAVTGAVALSAGGSHTCAAFADGSVQCWGDNPTHDNDGAPPDPDRSQPFKISAPDGAVALTSGLVDSCELIMNGQVACWGANSAGELGTGSTGYGSESGLFVAGW